MVRALLELDEANPKRQIHADLCPKTDNKCHTDLCKKIFLLFLHIT